MIDGVRKILLVIIATCYKNPFILVFGNGVMGFKNNVFGCNSSMGNKLVTIFQSPEI